jgi:predicted alternative tryptophan synthase beta-subunit
MGKKTVPAATPTLEEQLAALLAENARLKASRTAESGSVTIKVSGQGAVSFYGLGRFPITLYKGAIDKLFETTNAEQIRQFVALYANALSAKGDEKLDVPEGMQLTPRSDAFTLGGDFAAFAKTAAVYEPKLVPRKA